jgi:hypothetical protein
MDGRGTRADQQTGREARTVSGAGGGFLGEQAVDIHLNGAAHWAGVPSKVWEYTLGGYQVLKKWLSYREAPLLGRPLMPEEAEYFVQVVRRIAAILLLGPALDAAYAKSCLQTSSG